jgi:hypothetical protein
LLLRCTQACQVIKHPFTTKIWSVNEYSNDFFVVFARS